MSACTVYYLDAYIYATFFVFLCPFFYFNSEDDLEEVLTFYTQKTKSPTVFLGAKVRTVEEGIHEVNASGGCEDSKSECFFPTNLTVGLFCV